MTYPKIRHLGFFFVNWMRHTFQIPSPRFIQPCLRVWLKLFWCPNSQKTRKNVVSEYCPLSKMIFIISISNAWKSIIKSMSNRYVKIFYIRCQKCVNKSVIRASHQMFWITVKLWRCEPFLFTGPVDISEVKHPSAPSFDQEPSFIFTAYLYPDPSTWRLVFKYDLFH